MVDIFFAVDGEMTGSKSPEEYQLIQIGVAGERAYDMDDVFVSDIGYDDGKFKFTEEALKVNKFTPERITAGPKPWIVDADLVGWLLDNHGIENKCIAVGWNVGSFDMPFVRKYLPESAKMFSYRSLDLNSVCFTLADVTGFSWSTIKHHAKIFAENTIPGTPDWHNAGYDALASLRAWEYLKSLIVIREQHHHL